MAMSVTPTVLTWQVSRTGPDRRRRELRAGAKPTDTAIRSARRRGRGIRPSPTIDRTNGDALPWLSGSLSPSASGNARLQSLSGIDDRRTRRSFAAAASSSAASSSWRRNASSVDTSRFEFTKIGLEFVQRAVNRASHREPSSDQYRLSPVDGSRAVAAGLASSQRGTADIVVRFGASVVARRIPAASRALRRDRTATSVH